MIKQIVSTALFAGTLLTQTPAFSQEEAPASRSEVSVQALGSFVKSTNLNGVEQSATNSGGVLASYRFFFDRHNGVEVNYGYERNSQNYGLTNGPLGIGSNAHEVSADYILRFPARRWSPFVLAGVGALIFDPRNVSQSALAGFLQPGSQGNVSAQTRASFIYGGGADFKLTSHLFLRAEYRGFVYNSPTYDFSGLSGLDRTTHRAQPSIGFGYRF
jgi:outer membrane immunogenic protein